VQIVSLKERISQWLHGILQKVSIEQIIYGESFRAHKLSNKLSKFHLLDCEKRVVLRQLFTGKCHTS
jgi:hypothetical protein